MYLCALLYCLSYRGTWAIVLIESHANLLMSHSKETLSLVLSSFLSLSSLSLYLFSLYSSLVSVTLSLSLSLLSLSLSLSLLSHLSSSLLLSLSLSPLSLSLLSLSLSLSLPLSSLSLPVSLFSCFLQSATPHKRFSVFDLMISRDWEGRPFVFVFIYFSSYLLFYLFR